MKKMHLVSLHFLLLASVLVSCIKESGKQNESAIQLTSSKAVEKQVVAELQTQMDQALSDNPDLTLSEDELEELSQVDGISPALLNEVKSIL